MLISSEIFVQTPYHMLTSSFIGLPSSMEIITFKALGTFSGAVGLNTTQHTPTQLEEVVLVNIWATVSSSLK